MKFNDNFQLDDLYPEIFDDFDSEFDTETNDEILEHINPEPLDISDLEDWDNEMGLDEL